MDFEPDALIARRIQLRQRTEEHEARGQELERAALALNWQQDLVNTLARGGRTRSEFPYDFEGAWRLVASDVPNMAYETVVAEEELPAGVEARRRVVPQAALATLACENCRLDIPLIGRTTGVESGMGDVGLQSEVAVVHCDTVQIVDIQDDNDETYKLPFQPHQHLVDQTF